MKPRLNWHFTPWGRAICFVGDIKPSIPVLLAVAATMAYGTYVESTSTADHALRQVYGSPWFMALMIWIALALTCAVITRWPWQRKHAGFIIVHAGLITTTVGGFMSLFGRIEGTMVVQEGGVSDSIQTKGRQLIVQEIPGTSPETIATYDMDLILATQPEEPIELSGMTIRFVELWENSRSELDVFDDAASPLEAIELAFDPNATRGDWLPQSIADNPAARFFGIQFRVLPKGESFEPVPPGEESEETPDDRTASADESSIALTNAAQESAQDAPADALPDSSQEDSATEERIIFQHPDGTVLELPAEGEIIIEGWTVQEVRMFVQAEVGENGLEEAEVERDNPAVQVILQHTDGSVERHIAFAMIPDLVFAKQLNGESQSGLSLSYVSAVEPATDDSMPPGHPVVDEESPTSGDRNRLVFTHDDSEFKATWVRDDGSFEVFDLSGDGPWEIDLDGNVVYILNHYTRARQGERFFEADLGRDNVPVLIAEINEGYDSRTVQVPFRGRASFIREGAIRPTFFIFAPKTFQVPFEVQLVDFRKTDYPGSDMAMAYESDVVFFPKGDDRSRNSWEQRIWMNHPLEYEGWKIYQSGFQGDTISFFSVMKDPGLWTTYIGCILVCGGILVMFYIPPFTRGHPGVPQLGTSAKGSNSK